MTVGLIGGGIAYHTSDKESVDMFSASLEVSSTLHTEIRRGAKDGNCSYDYLVDLARKESNLNPYAKNKRSTALGLYQFVNATWKELQLKHPGKGITAKGRTDVYISSKAACLFTNDTKKRLERNLGRSVTNKEIYIAHFAGVSGALKLLRAKDNASVATVLGNHVVRANPVLKGKTVGQAKKILSSGIDN